MTTERDNNDYRVLRNFLTSPLHKRHFQDFYLLCCRLTIASLRYLKYHGFKLPVDKQVGANSVQDVAIDILGTFLAAAKGEPGFVIFDFFRRRGGQNFLKRDDEWLFDHFLALVRGHVRQEVSHLHGDINPQVVLLKRRFKECLNDAAYSRALEGPYKHFVYLTIFHDQLRNNCPVIPFEGLVEIARSAVQSSKNRVSWCRSIFESLLRAVQYRNGVYQHELLSAVTIVNAEMVELDGIVPGHILSPDAELEQKRIESLCSQAITNMQATVASRFVEQGRLSQYEADRLVEACRKYLDDCRNGGEADKLPAYFREALPEVSHNDYLKHYKYLFDAMKYSLVEYIRENID